MTRTRSRRARTTLVAAGTLALLMPATAAQAAAPTVVTGGATTLRPAGPAYRTLARAGVRVRSLGDARASGSRFVLPVTGGQRGRVTVLEHGATDGLQLQGRDDAVRLTGLRVRLGRSARVTGRVDGGAASTLFVLKASGLSGTAASGRATRRNVTWRLSAKAARTLRRELGVRDLRAGAFATTSLTALLQKPGAPPAPGAPAPGPAAPAPGGPAPRVVAGTAGWGVKTSFRNYVGSASGGATGKIEVSDGATRVPDGTFGFGAGTGTVDRATGALDVAFRGQVYFEKHGSGESAALRLWVRNPRVVFNGTVAMLHADVSSKDSATARVVDYPNVALAQLDLTKGSRTATDSTVTWTAIPATLTEAGAPAFAGFYGAGTELDPISFSVTTG
ncbi:HtaA domain-containing protein [Patulibacter americanus]|uniref:HtaA domain-containing protein n=1 Tax=Patulibacter americanus TaxID=588672 RepID=UPI0003B47806|nr:HtaA domain-containing protein [Patulibacter americanus]